VIDRRGLINALQRMPDEAFKWVALAIAATIYTGPLEEFTPLGREAIKWARHEAQRWLQRHADDAQERGRE
jgi:hypothetical protein